ncbi:MAG: porin [Isosphaeraceae bacterium]|nr:porin [Isosphaeraceae bacterium]
MSRPSGGWPSTILIATVWGCAGLAAAQPGEPPAATRAEDPGRASLEELTERLRRMEAMNQELLRRLDESRREQDAKIDRLTKQIESMNGRRDAEIAPAAVQTPPVPNPAIAEPSPTVPPVDPPEAVPNPRPIFPPSLPDDSDDPVVVAGESPPAPRAGSANSGGSGRERLGLSFDPGFSFQTPDAAYRLEVHLLSEIESRVWSPGGRLPPGSGVNGIYLPRQRFFFMGNITPKLEYELSINRGLGAINILNAYVNLRFDERLQLRVGRYFTPVLYDQYKIPTMWTPTPERSLFAVNLGPSRQIGAKAWGFLFDRRLEYAVGLFNGSRNSFENLNGSMDFMGFLNLHPFQAREESILRDLYFGTSVAVGRQDQSPVPVAFRVGAISPDANNPGSASVPFLVLDPDVIERGANLLGSVHAAYYYRGLSLLGEWQYGYGSYADSTRVRSLRVPYHGYYAAAGYFLTGEEVRRRAKVEPRRPLIPTRAGQIRGLGAWEVVARYSVLSLGSEVFRGGFADSDVWSTGAATTEVGVNWYWNDYVKIYAFWLHGGFDDPILARPDSRLSDVDMFWMRFQLFF